VYFVEEPILDPECKPFLEITHAEAGVTLCRLHSPIEAVGFARSHDDEFTALLPAFLKQEKISELVVWLYTPLALPLLQSLSAIATVYDVMDELSAFKDAPPELLEWETKAYETVNVVFTGGPSLYAAKKGRHGNVHCFPSSVDLVHYQKALNSNLDPPDQVDLPRPRLGYFGVIDERIDLALIDQLATSHPEWQIQMVGPVCKIDPQDLPNHPNIHYYGQRSYADLPSYLSGWDVCLVPFALNESTKFISPTKTLEYMAAEKMIVSTLITDVVVPYGDIVYGADGAFEFVQACERALTEAPSEKAARIEKMRGVLAKTSWDQTVQAMAAEIAQASNSSNSIRPATSGSHSESWPIVIAGAGPTGLSAAYHAQDALLLERNDTVGGWCRSIQQNGYTWDYAGHIMFTNDPYIEKMYEILLRENVHWQDREAWIYSKNVFTRYPFQGALYGLPPDVIRECIVGAIEARFGSLKGDQAQPGSQLYLAKHAPVHGSNGNGVHNPLNGKSQCASTDRINDCCGDGILESTARLTNGELRRPNAEKSRGGNGSHPPANQYANFEEFIYKVWGAGIAKHFAIPYNQKLWAVPLTEMETSWLGGRVPLPDLEEMIEGALRPVPKPMGPNARFGYPLRGGFQALMEGFLTHIGNRLRLNANVVTVSPRAHLISLADGSTIQYDHLVSTMPLPFLVRSIGEEAPPEIHQAAAGLQYISVRCVYLAVARENVSDKHWIYYPEDSIFHRIFVQGNASPYCNAPGGFCFTCEITYSPQYKPLPCEGQALIDRCVADCIKVGFIKESDQITAAAQADLRPYAGAECEGYSGVARRPRYPAGRPIQRVGILQFRSCLHGRQARRGVDIKTTSTVCMKLIS
jgi:UDP-galactopyranose mutase